MDSTITLQINDLVKIVALFFTVFVLGGLLIPLSYALFLLVGILKDVRKTSKTVKENITNPSILKENLTNSLQDVTNDFFVKQKSNLELAVLNSVYKVLKKAKA